MELSEYFRGIKSVSEAKRIYHTLACKYHPDRGGSEELMKLINNLYEACLLSLDGTTETGSDNKEHRYSYNQEIEKGVIDMLDKLFKCKINGIHIALIGTWLWVTGDTKTNKEVFKTLGFKYSGDKEAWYYHAGKYRPKSAHRGTFKGMAMKYGYREFSDTGRLN